MNYSGRETRVAVSTVIAGSVMHAAILFVPVTVFGGAAAVRFGASPLMLCGLILCWSTAESLCSRRRGGADCEVSRQTVPNLAMGLSLLCVHWVCVWESFHGNETGAIMLTVGALWMVTGAALRLGAMCRLGDRFLDDVALLSEHPYETGGLYGWLRHPSETGTLLLAAGGGLIAGSVAAMILIAVVVMPCILLRVRREDKLLAKEFGEVFLEHSRRVPAIVPGVRWHSQSI